MKHVVFLKYYEYKTDFAKQIGHIQHKDNFEEKKILAYVRFRHKISCLLKKLSVEVTNTVHYYWELRQEKCLVIWR